MAKELKPAGFDYAGMTADDSSKLCHLAGYIGKAKGEFVTSLVEIGKHLKDAQGVLAAAGCEGRFTAWVEAECGFSRSTAYRYMDGFDFLGEGNCPSLGRLFTAEAVYLLGAANSPEAAGKKAIRLAKKGEHINTAKAKKFIAEATPPPDPDDDPPADDPEPDDGYGEPIDDECDEGAPLEGDGAGDDLPPAVDGRESGGHEGGRGDTAAAPGSPVPVVFDDKIIDNLIGRLARSLDDKARTEGGQGPRHGACMNTLNEFQCDWEMWKERGGK